MTLKEAAKAYFDLGLNIVVTKDKKALVKWEKWQTQRQTFEEFETQPWQNADGFAVICGTQLKNGLFLAVIDKDVKNLPLEIVEKGTKALKDFPITQTEKTPSGGLHLIYFSRKKPRSISAYHNNYGLELFGENKYCVMAPSQGYSRLNDNSPTEIEDLTEIFYKVLGIKETHAWFNRDDLINKLPYKGSNPPCIEALLRGTNQGLRNEYGIRLASYFCNFKKLSTSTILKILKNWNKLNSPPIDEKELETVLKSAYQGKYVYGCNDEVLKTLCDRDSCLIAPKILTREQQTKAEALLDDPKLLDYLVAYGKKRLIEEDNLLKQNFIVLCSGQTRYPISEIISGFSGSGKNESIRAIKQLIPPEWIFEFTTSTPEAVKYIPEEFAGTLVIYEIAGMESKTGTLGLRAVGEGESIETIYPMRDEATGKMMLGHATTNAKNFVTTESDLSVHPDLYRRVLKTSTNDDDEVTKKVLEKKLNDAAMPDSLRQQLHLDNETVPYDPPDFQNALRLIDWNVEAIVFQPNALLTLMECATKKEQRVALRSQIERILNFIRVLAILNQRRRVIVKDKDGKLKYVIANPEDYSTAMTILESTILETISRIEKRQKEVLALFETNSQLDKNKLAEKLKMSTVTAARCLKTLANIGYLRELQASKPFNYELIADKSKPFILDQKTSEYTAFYKTELEKFLNTTLSTCQNKLYTTKNSNKEQIDFNTEDSTKCQGDKMPTEPELGLLSETEHNQLIFSQRTKETRQTGGGI
jgi:hypothetical protein